jgi:hypothetical protein
MIYIREGLFILKQSNYLEPWIIAEADFSCAHEEIRLRDNQGDSG